MVIGKDVMLREYRGDLGSKFENFYVSMYCYSPTYRGQLDTYLNSRTF